MILDSFLSLYILFQCSLPTSCLCCICVTKVGIFSIRILTSCTLANSFKIFTCYTCTFNSLLFTFYTLLLPLVFLLHLWPHFASATLWTRVHFCEFRYTCSNWGSFSDEETSPPSASLDRVFFSKKNILSNRTTFKEVHQLVLFPSASQLMQQMRRWVERTVTIKSETEGQENWTLVRLPSLLERV